MDQYLLFFTFLLPAILTAYVIFKSFLTKDYFYKHLMKCSYSIGFWILQFFMYIFSFAEGQDILGKNTANIFSSLIISIKYYWTWVYPGCVILFLLFAFIPGIVIYLIGKSLENVK